MKFKIATLFLLALMLHFVAEAQFRLDVPGNARIRGRLDLSYPHSGSVYIGTLAGENDNGSVTERNVFIGFSAGRSNSRGESNTFVGDASGEQNVSGTSNTFLGSISGMLNVSGTANTFLGAGAGYRNTTAGGNTYVGAGAGQYSQTGTRNTIVGGFAGVSSLGSYNTFLGYNTGENNANGSSLTLLGYNADVTNGSLSNATAVGNNARVACSNCMVLGASYSNAVNVGIGTENPRGALHLLKAGAPPRGLSAAENGLLLGIESTAGYKWIQSYGGDLVINPHGNDVGIGLTNTSYQLQLSQNSAAKPGSATWTIASDARLKTGVSDFEDGLTVLQKIHPVWFEYNGEADLPKGEKFVGVLAQEVQEIAPYLVKPYTYEDADGNKTEYLGYDANALLYILVNAVQEQQTTIAATALENQTLKNDLAALRKELEELKTLVFNKISHQTIVNPSADSNLLGQNAPNPFGSATTITYDIPKRTKQAILQITAANGSVVQRIPLEDRGQGQVQLSLDTPGTYFYSLILDGKLTATRQMIRIGN